MRTPKSELQRGFALMSIAVTMALAGAAAAQVCPSPGSCFVPQETPGCDLEYCCNLVCKVDPFCCETSWDRLCVDEANQICGCGGFVNCIGCGDRNAGSCYAEHGAACSDETCCLTVCSLDPACCMSAWDALCVDEALALCAGCGCPGDLDLNGVVNAADLAILLGAWGGNDPCADLDGTGDVNSDDLPILLRVWGPC